VAAKKGQRKANAAKLKQIWLSGQYNTLTLMAEGLKAAGTPQSLTTLKRYSAKDGWAKARAKIAPEMEKRANKKLIAKGGDHLARIKLNMASIGSELSGKILPALKNAKRLNVEQALKGVKEMVRILDRLELRHPLDQPPPPTGEGPGSASINQATQVNIHLGGEHQAPQDEGEFSDETRFSDEQLQDIIRQSARIIDQAPAPARLTGPKATKNKPAGRAGGSSKGQ
jgi:hypothetical protein